MLHLFAWVFPMNFKSTPNYVQLYNIYWKLPCSLHSLSCWTQLYLKNKNPALSYLSQRLAIRWCWANPSDTTNNQPFKLAITTCISGTYTANQTAIIWGLPLQKKKGYFIKACISDLLQHQKVFVVYLQKMKTVVLFSSQLFLIHKSIILWYCTDSYMAVAWVLTVKIMFWI